MRSGLCLLVLNKAGLSTTFNCCSLGHEIWFYGNSFLRVYSLTLQSSAPWLILEPWSVVRNSIKGSNGVNSLWCQPVVASARSDSISRWRTVSATPEHSHAIASIPSLGLFNKYESTYEEFSSSYWSRSLLHAHVVTLSFPPCFLPLLLSLTIKTYAVFFLG